MERVGLLSAFSLSPRRGAGRGARDLAGALQIKQYPQAAKEPGHCYGHSELFFQNVQPSVKDP